ncbi:hypothetical protein ABW20_dc0104791 [Dactylellina cionopaga]|nr:hypothetical protein ABW20_dc0104791 [Dactylellina cionopaga]
MVKRGLSPRDTSPIPSYASYCTSGARYASACSCFGVPASAVTAATPVTTITLYSTTTTYSTSSEAVSTDTVTNTITETSTTTAAAATATFTNTLFGAAIIEGAYPGNMGGNPGDPAYVDPFWYEFLVDDFADNGATGVLPIVRQYDGKLYITTAGFWKQFAFCQAFFGNSDDEMPYLRGLTTHRYGDSGAVSGNEVYCDWGSSSIINCNCTVGGVLYDRFVTFESRVLLASADYVPDPNAGDPSASITVKAVYNDYCDTRNVPGTYCANFGDPNLPS